MASSTMAGEGAGAERSAVTVEVERQTELQEAVEQATLEGRGLRSLLRYCLPVSSDAAVGRQGGGDGDSDEKEQHRRTEHKSTEHRVSESVSSCYSDWSELRGSVGRPWLSSAALRPPQLPPLRLLSSAHPTPPVSSSPTARTVARHSSLSLPVVGAVASRAAPEPLLRCR